MKELRGILVAMATPFTEDGEEVDWGALGILVDSLIEARVHGLVVAGSTGEFPTMTPEERRKLTEVVIEQAGGQVPVVIHTAAVRTRETIMYSKHAQESGADGLMIVPPYYEPLSEDEVYAHYEAVAEAVDLPIMLYNIPAAAGFDMKPSFVARLAEIDNIFYVKDSMGDVRRLRGMMVACGDRISIFNGSDTISFEGLATGAVGCVLGAGNVMPRQCVELFELVSEKGDLEGGRQLWDKMFPVCAFLEREGYVGAVKAGAELAGLHMGPPRRPILPLREEKRDELAELLERLGAI